jgi:ribonuclease BN (tRNA processing enzyme)
MNANPMTFKAVILGSGTIVPSLRRSACSVLVEIDQTRIVLDTGPGTMHRLLAAHTTIFDVSHIFYSHFHPDHIGELVTFLFATKYPHAEKRTQPLTLVGGPGFQQLWHGLQTAYGDWINLDGNLLKRREIEDPAGGSLRFDHFSVRTCATAHRPESVAYRIDLADGRSVVYSGDTDYCEDLIGLSEGTDLLVCECAMPDEMKMPGHLTPSLAGRMATAAGAKKLVLTHLYPECDRVDLIAQCRRTYGGPLEKAHDLMAITIHAAGFSGK